MLSLKEHQLKNSNKTIEDLISIIANNRNYYYREIKKKYPELYLELKNSGYFPEMLYQHIYKKDGKCKVCNSKSLFLSVHEGYRIYCSHSCYIQDFDSSKESRKQTSMDKYGVENPGQSEESKLKRKQTMLEKYGVEYALQNENFSKKSIEKYKKTYQENQTIIKTKKTKTIIQKYGSLENYNSINNKKRIDTVRNKYGVDHILSSDKIIKKSIETRKKHFYDNLNNRCPDSIPLFDTFDGVSKEYSWKCKNCNYEFHSNIDDGKFPECPVCSDKPGDSNGEKQISEYVSSLGIAFISKDKTVLKPKEIDIFCPDHKVGIEYNGSYYHSYPIVDKDYHLNKTIQCEEKNINLIHIWDYEWIKKKDLVRSIISSKLNKNTKIFARKGEIKEINEDEYRNFCNSNHIQGYVPSKIKLGLFFNNELTAIMSFGKSRYNQNYQYELLRYCSKKYSTVVGGSSKLFQYFIKHYNPSSVISYCDRRLFDGKMYEKLGFSFSHVSSPNYFYLKNNVFYSRIQCQKHKLKKILENFDEHKSEKENMLNNGYVILYDCGQKVYTYGRQ